jgi:acyl-CoA thioesterase-1
MVHIISRSSRFRFHMLGFAVAALAFACSEPGPAEPDVPPSSMPSVEAAAVRIVVLGDSLSAGLGLAESEAFPAVVRGLLRNAGYSVEVVNAGVSGDTTAGGVARVDWILKQEPDLLVVELGGNDALRGQPLENTESNLRQIIDRARGKGARVLLLGMDVPTNYGPDYARDFAEMYERIAGDEGVPFVPGFVREVGSDPSLLQADGLHPTAEGQRRLAQTLAPHLEKMLEGLLNP